jgi:hypothetical protein
MTEHAALELTATKRRKAKNSGESHSLGLPDQVKAVSGAWATPTGDDANNATRESGAFQSLTRQAGKLSPDWVETLMALPIGWTQLPHKFVKPKKGTL